MSADFSKAIALYVKAEKLRLSKKLDRALQGFQAVVEEESEFYEAYDKMGEIYYAVGKPSLSLECFARAAAGYIQNKKYVAAASVYMKISTLDPKLVKDSSKQIREQLSDLPFVDARVLNNSLICELVPRPAFFEPLSEQEFAQVMRSLNPTELSAGEVLFEEGDTTSKSIYMIYSGRMAVMVKDEQGKEFTVATLKAGEFFGEFSFLTDAPRSATMRAQEDTCLFELTRAEMRKLMQQHRGIGQALQEYYKRRVLDLGLAKSQVFASLSAEQRTPIIDKFTFKTMAKEQTVLDTERTEGQLFLVKTGKLRVNRVDGDPEKAEKIVPGEMFGCFPKIGGAMVSLSVVAVEDCELVLLSGKDLTEILDKHPAVRGVLSEAQKRRGSAFVILHGKG